MEFAERKYSIFFEIMKYCITGIISVLLNVILIVMLTEIFKIHYLISTMTCFTTVTIGSFFLNRRWTFRMEGKARAEEIAKYFTVTLVNMGLCLFLTWRLVGAGVPYYAATIGLSVLFVPVNFLWHRLWSFGLRFRRRILDRNA